MGARERPLERFLDAPTQENGSERGCLDIPRKHFPKACLSDLQCCLISGLCPLAANCSSLVWGLSPWFQVWEKQTSPIRSTRQWLWECRSKNSYVSSSFVSACPKDLTCKKQGLVFCAYILLVLRLKNIASIFGNRFYFIYKFIKFEYRNPKFETIGINDLKKQNSKQRKNPNRDITVSYFEYYFLFGFRFDCFGFRYSYFEFPCRWIVGQVSKENQHYKLPLYGTELIRHGTSEKSTFICRSIFFVPPWGGLGGVSCIATDNWWQGTRGLHAHTV